jgi:hypothetical protein
MCLRHREAIDKITTHVYLYYLSNLYWIINILTLLFFHYLLVQVFKVTF